MTLFKPFLLITFFLLALLTACGESAKPTPMPTAESLAYSGTIIAMGDSLTEGLGVASTEAYPSKLARKLQAEGYHYEVINAGVSGETSSGAASRLDWILKLEPDIVILTTGGNDGLRGIDPAITETNLRQMIETFQAEDKIVVLGGLQMLQNLGEEYTTAFAEIYPKVAADSEVVFIPFFLDGVAGVPELNQPDVIHPTAEGYDVVVETIYPHVVEAIKQFEEKGITP